MLGSCLGPLNRVYFQEKLETGRGVRLYVSLYQPPSFESEVFVCFQAPLHLCSKSWSPNLTDLYIC